MREKVNKAVAELGYRPRLAARAMRGQSFTVGIGYSDFGNPFFTRMLSGALAALSDTPYQVVIAPAEEGERQGIEAMDSLVDRQVDGILAVSPRVPQADIERIAGQMPVVMFGRHDNSAAYDAVVGDDARGTAAALQHLADLGHQRIAHLTVVAADTRGDTAHGIRLREYRRFMDRPGMAQPQVIRTNEGQDAAYEVMVEAIGAGADFTAVFAAHDDLAIGALTAVRELRPDISVVGYDDIPIARNPAFGLTTVHQPGVEMGARAAALLLERVEGRDEAVHEMFSPELRVRRSSFPPALP